MCFSLDKLNISKFAVAQTVSDNSSNTLIDLDGRWAAGDNHSAIISQSATNLTVDMSAFDRPSAYGSILNESTIAVIFPDDESYNGKLVPPDKIEWSNNSTWKKETS
jgi:plastocyanin domain-containing protein